MLTAWRERATDVRGRSLPCGHFIPEEMPDEAISAVMTFLGSV